MRLFNKRKKKVFCIGQNKTGTTTVKKALDELGFKVGNQAEAELLLKDYLNRDFKPILEYCHTAEAFQDIPFSMPYTYVILDHYFPNSKFILTVRDNADQWYKSITRFHAKRFGNGNIPSKAQLQHADYRYKGAMWDYMSMYSSPAERPYDELTLKRFYEAYNQQVIDYFKDKGNLLVINVSEKKSYAKFCAFLGKEAARDSFSWENKTANL